MVVVVESITVEREEPPDPSVLLVVESSVDVNGACIDVVVGNDVVVETPAVVTGDEEGASVVVGTGVDCVETIQMRPNLPTLFHIPDGHCVSDTQAPSSSNI